MNNTPRTSAEVRGRIQQCGGCGEHFTSLKGFDRHRVGSFKHYTRRCVDPEEVGLEVKKVPQGSAWGFPGAWKKEGSNYGDEHE